MERLSKTRNRRGHADQPRQGAPRGKHGRSWKTAFEEPTSSVEGMLSSARVKGGFTVDLSTAPWRSCQRSQVDIRPVRDVAPLMGTPQPFQILKMDRRRGNIVVSRRAVLEESRAEARRELSASLAEGQVLAGVVKNITDYGAFVDLGGVDGLLHVTDIAWRRINHPTEASADRPDRQGAGHPLQPGDPAHQPRHEAAGGRSVGRRRGQVSRSDAQLQGPRHQHHRLRRLRGAGAGVEGLVHVSEMSWTKKNVHPGKIVSTSQEVEVQVLEVDPIKRRISLGLKQTMDNPLGQLRREVPVGSQSSRAKSRTSPSSVCSSVCRRRSTAWCTLSDLDWNRPGERGHRGIQARRHGQGARFSTSTPTRSASRSASSSCKRIHLMRPSRRWRSHPSWRYDHRHGYESHRWWPRTAA